jgi:hypothetical protein
MDPMPIITLANGLKVGNFSSPHPFTFTTGEILPRCSEKRVKALELVSKETIYKTLIGTQLVDNIQLSFELDEQLELELEACLIQYSTLVVDIILVPLPVMTCLRKPRLELASPFRVIRTADRETKAIYPDRFCL